MNRSRLKLTLVRHRRDMVAIAIAAGLALFTLSYILSHQVAFRAPDWLPGGEDTYHVDAEFARVNGIIPGAGQPVTVAGVQVGNVEDVNLEEGRANVSLAIDAKYAPVYNDATLLVRQRTALKDMSIALDPGTEEAGEVDDGDALPVSQSQPDVSFDEILGNLDVDARNYLRVLLAAGSGAFSDTEDPSPSGAPSPAAVADLQGALKSIEPLARNTEAVTQGLALRRQNLKRAIHGFEQVAVALGSVDSELATLVDTAARTFEASGQQDEALGAALEELPSTLAQTKVALGGLTELENEVGPALDKLGPFARGLGPALRDNRPFVRETLPVLRDQVMPFTRDVLPVVKVAQNASYGLANGFPPVTRTFKVLNGFTNALAYNPPGSEEGYLFWASWLGHIGASLTSIQDAHGAAVRSLPLAICAQLDALHQVELGNPTLSPILKLLNPADRLEVCPNSLP